MEQENYRDPEVKLSRLSFSKDEIRDTSGSFDFRDIREEPIDPFEEDPLVCRCEECVCEDSEWPSTEEMEKADKLADLSDFIECLYEDLSNAVLAGGTVCVSKDWALGRPERIRIEITSL